MFYMGYFFSKLKIVCHFFFKLQYVLLVDKTDKRTVSKMNSGKKNLVTVYSLILNKLFAQL